MKQVSDARAGRRVLPSLERKPIRCILPWASGSAFTRVLSGDPTITSQVKSASAADVGKFVAAQLMSLDPRDRDMALRIASSKAKGKRMDIVPISALMPEDADVAQIATLWNGLALMLLSLGTASADTSVGTVVANATSMASGVPFASDPMVAERQNEVLLAKAILEAALLDDAAAKKWFADNKLAEALQHQIEVSAYGSTDMNGVAEDAYSRLAKLYDCYVHEEPLGGDAFEGGVIGDFFKNTWNGLKAGLGTAIKTVSDKVVGDLRRGSTDAGGDAADSTSGGAESDPETAGSTDRGETADLPEVVATELSAAKKAVESAKASLDKGQNNIADYRAKLQDAALQQAKLQWAEAVLSAPTEVATMLSATTPNMADPASFLQTVLSSLAAARATGNVGTLKALLYALKAAAGRGDLSADSLYSMLSGDPGASAPADDTQLGDSLLRSKLVAQKRDLLARADVGEETLDMSGRSDEPASKRGKSTELGTEPQQRQDGAKPSPDENESVSSAESSQENANEDGEQEGGQ